MSSAATAIGWPAIVASREVLASRPVRARDVEARPAHVDRHEGRLPAAGRGGEAADDSCRRAREHRLHGPMSDRARRAETAVRLHDVERCSCTSATQAFDQVAEVQLDHRRDVGVGHGRRGALVFHDVRQDVARERDVGVGSPAASCSPIRRSCARVVVGVEEPHGDRLHRPVGEDADHLAHLAPRRAPSRPARAARRARRSRTRARGERAARASARTSRRGSGRF